MDSGDNSGLLFDILPGGTVSVEGLPEEDTAPLWPGEEELVEGAVPSRRREVKAGRHCARQALARLGAPVGPLPADSDRVPQWPSGVCGSITHTDRYVAAAVSPRKRMESLGIDAEHVSRVAADFMKSIARPNEARWLSGLPESVSPRGRALLFSGKEAAYKCQFPLTREAVGFLDASVDVGDDGLGTSGTFRVSFRQGTMASDLPTIHGYYHFSNDLVGTVAFVHNADHGP